MYVLLSDVKKISILGAIDFIFKRKIDVIFTVAVFTAASLVWVRKGSDTYQRGGA